MRHESHNGEGIGYAETTFSELTLGHLARHMGTRPGALESRTRSQPIP
jgi:hypothetical protein